MLTRVSKTYVLKHGVPATKHSFPSRPEQQGFK